MVFELVDFFPAVALVSNEAAGFHRVHQLLRLEVRATEDCDDCGTQIAFAAHVSARRGTAETPGKLLAESFEVDLFGDHV